jgi:hypothetical protein
MKKKNYTVQWACLCQPSIANVSILASQIARELGVTNTPRTIYEAGRCVEMLNKGKR